MTLLQYLEGIRVLFLAWRAYRQAIEHGGATGYCGDAERGVCCRAVFVGVGREAWRVSAIAIETFELHQVEK